MKLTSFIRDKTSGYGVVTEDGIIDLSSSIEGASDIKSLLETNSMARAADYSSGRSADFPVDEITFHQYYFKGPTANRSGEQFYDVGILDSLLPKIDIAVAHADASARASWPATATTTASKASNAHAVIARRQRRRAT